MTKIFCEDLKSEEVSKEIENLSKRKETLIEKNLKKEARLADCKKEVEKIKEKIVLMGEKGAYIKEITKKYPSFETYVNEVTKPSPENITKITPEGFSHFMTITEKSTSNPYSFSEKNIGDLKEITKNLWNSLQIEEALTEKIFQYINRSFLTLSRN